MVVIKSEYILSFIELFYFAQVRCYFFIFVHIFVPEYRKIGSADAIEIFEEPVINFVCFLSQSFRTKVMFRVGVKEAPINRISNVSLSSLSGGPKNIARALTDDL